MNTGPDHLRWQDASGAYALGALPGDEREGYETHLATCETCRAEVDDLLVAAEALPVSVPPMLPSAALKDRIMAEVRREASLLAAAGPQADRPPAPAPVKRRWRERFGLPMPALALACAALLAGIGAGALVFGGGDDGRTIPFERGGGLTQTASAELDVTDGKAVLVARGLPAPSSGRTYQVWLQRPGHAPEPTSALFTPRRDGSATASVTGDLNGVDKVLVNQEPDGGSTTPTSPVLLTASLT